MKKLFSILMICVVVVSLFGCGAKSEVSSSGDKLVVALNAEFPPYEYKDGGEIVGIDPDMVREIGKRLGMEVEFLDIAFDSVIPAIQSGKADIAATGLTVTEDRKNFVNFTDMYQDAVQVIIVTEDSEIKSKDDMNGKIIGVQTGTTGDMYCTDELEEVNMLRFAKIIDGVQALAAGKVDACVVDDQVAMACVEEVNKANPDAHLIILPTAFVEEHYAMAVNKKNTELLDKVNGALRDMMNDGTLKNIKSKYLDD